MELKDLFERIRPVPENYILEYAPVSDEAIEKAEKILNAKLPQEYKDFLRISNGLLFGGGEIFGIENVGSDLLDNNRFNHYEEDNPMPESLVAFYPDGFGNFICFDTANGNIVFWQHDYEYGPDDMPEVVASSFLEYLEGEFLPEGLDFIEECEAEKDE